MEKMKAYSLYIEQEDTFYKQLEALEQCQCAMFDYIFRYGDQFHPQMVEEVLMNVHHLEVNVRLELLHLRLAKAFLAYEMNRP
ncbi:hypothetical protein ACFOQM_16145 [Paenibacillus sp. GCM10012307]|uniref:Uncharacterized protein n=1 Tax=Paenibacillus roseus TaxID=2798579 RepID=A0A934J4L9_9BACL|nr:hypothetical protein [Paenibacillus roseus]MBJ6362775.1 hypothetical protein [Paenibacillus roseus]